MPYGYRKSGDKITVFKKKPDGSTEVVGHTTASKLKGYLAALHMHSKDMKEATKTTKAANIKAAEAEVEAAKERLKDAQLKLQNAQREPVTMGESFKLSNYIRTMLEAEGDVTSTDKDPEATPEDAPSPEPSGDEASAESDKETKAAEPDNLTVKFNMARVMRYNQYPVTDNVGTVTGVTKNGMSVQVGDNIIFVDFKDLLD